MRMRATLTLTAILLSGLVAPGEARPSGIITVHGGGTAWVTVDVPANVTIDLWKTTVSTSGRFGGFYLEAVRGSDSVGGVLLRDFHAPGDTAYLKGLGSGSGDVAKGRYRLYLIGDAPTVVRIPVAGMTSKTFTPTRRTHAAASVQTLTRTALGVRGRQPLLATPRSISFSSLLIDDLQVFAGRVAVCVTKTEGRCDGRWDGDHPMWYVNPYGSYAFVLTLSYAPGMKSGRLDAVQEADNVAGVKYAAGASFTLTLV